MPFSRREALVLGAVALAYAGFRNLGTFWPGGAPDFVPLQTPAGYRRLVDAGPLSGGFDMTVGLGDAPVPGTADAPGAGDAAPDLKTPEALCTALFGGGDIAPGTVPVASFSDFFCPYCRVLGPMLQDIARDGAVRITWHEVPLLGRASEMAARAALAAERQDGYLAIYDSLIRSGFVPTRGYLSRIAQEAGLDGAQFLRDLDAPGLESDLARSRAVFRRFGFAGTPALVVGRTAVIGRIERAALEQLIEVEAAEAGPPPGCTAA